MSSISRSTVFMVSLQFAKLPISALHISLQDERRGGNRETISPLRDDVAACDARMDGFSEHFSAL